MAPAAYGCSLHWIIWVYSAEFRSSGWGFVHMPTIFTSPWLKNRPFPHWLQNLVWCELTWRHDMQIANRILAHFWSKSQVWTLCGRLLAILILLCLSIFIIMCLACSWCFKIFGKNTFVLMNLKCIEYYDVYCLWQYCEDGQCYSVGKW